MSERGSFVTQYVYCPACFAVLRRHLLGDAKYWRAIELPAWTGSNSPTLPIIAGKLGGLASGDELRAMESLRDTLDSELCHRVRVAVLADSGESRVIVFG